MENWKDFINKQKFKDYYKNIISFIKEDEKIYSIYPNKKDIFNAFKLTPLNKVKAIILGQDPYHGPGQAHGLSFSVLSDVDKPPSLKNIFKELRNDLNIEPPNHGNLQKWAERGVLLLNTSLTVRSGQPNSHQKIGWSIFTDEAIKALNAKLEPVAFVLWGANAKSKKPLISNSRHLIIESAHPSPLSAHNGFFGSKPFSKVNEFLLSNNIEPIDWKL